MKSGNYVNNFKAQKYLNCVLELRFGVECDNIFLWKISIQTNI